MAFSPTQKHNVNVFLFFPRSNKILSWQLYFGRKEKNKSISWLIANIFVSINLLYSCMVKGGVFKGVDK